MCQERLPIYVSRSHSTVSSFMSSATKQFVLIIFIGFLIRKWYNHRPISFVSRNHRTVRWASANFWFIAEWSFFELFRVKYFDYNVLTYTLSNLWVFQSTFRTLSTITFCRASLLRWKRMTRKRITPIIFVVILSLLRHCVLQLSKFVDLFLEVDRKAAA